MKAEPALGRGAERDGSRWRAEAALRAAGRRVPRTGRARGRDFFLNWPLMVGLLIVLGLLLVVLFGPLLAPENPYLAGKRSVTFEDGRVQAPPYPPGPGVPLGTDQWGRDILSMLLYGARNTLVACLFITTARVILGWFLGAIAAWHEGRLLDRVIMSAIELTSSLPMLLTGVILILALDIRRGILVFMAALCLVGWGEIAQYVRAEFMVVRRKPFIEGARAIGLDGPGIAIRHVLPNVLPALSVLALLEMGAVLMILGELGFVGVFIGGGTTVESMSAFRQVAIPDVPEWGAMMADSRLWARSQPWMVFYPALAFFVAVLGFNLLGEGLRRLIQRGGVNTSFIFSRKMLVALTTILLATAYIVTHVGPAPSYARLAQRFDTTLAMTHLEALTSEGVEGREVGTPGADAAAEYIAARFREYGLQPYDQRGGYFQAVPLRLVRPLEQPELAVVTEDGTVSRSFAHRVDFGEDILRHGGSGTAQAPLTFVDFCGAPSGRAYKGLDLRGRVAMYVAGEAPAGFDLEALVRGAEGLLIVDNDVQPRLQLASEDQEYLRPPTIATFRITRSAADALLGEADLSLAELAASLQAEPDPRPWRQTDLPVRVSLKLQLSEVQEIEGRNVLGIWPGSDVLLDEELVIVSTHYDAAGRDPDGTLFPGASNNASGVAAMLDVLRLWREEGFTPRRTVLFAAWTGGMLERGGAYRYADSSRVSALRPVAALHLLSVGRGGDALLINRSADELGDLARRSAEAMGTNITVGSGPLVPALGALSDRCPSIMLTWEGAGEIPPAADSPASIDADKLGEAGQIVNLMLITLTREAAY